jgi:hypothetical protein
MFHEKVCFNFVTKSKRKFPRSFKIDLISKFVESFRRKVKVNSFSKFPRSFKIVLISKFQEKSKSKFILRIHVKVYFNFVMKSKRKFVGSFKIDLISEYM